MKWAIIACLSVSAAWANFFFDPPTPKPAVQWADQTDKDVTFPLDRIALRPDGKIVHDGKVVTDDKEQIRLLVLAFRRYISLGVYR